MWIKLGNGRIELVHHEAHIKRLLNEGGQEVLDPRVKKVEEEPTEPVTEESEQADASTTNDEPVNQSGPNHGRRSSRRKPAV